MELAEIEHNGSVYRKLCAIAKKLHTIDERDCNGYYSNLEAKRNTRREARLVAQAKELAKSLGLLIYRQGDPRGPSLYLIDETMDKSNYNNGVALGIWELKCTG